MLCGGDGIEELEEAFDPSDLQGLVNALIDADEGKGASAILAGDIGADESADSSGIGEGDGGEIEDEDARIIGANLRLEAEDVGEDEWSSEAEDADSFFGAGNLFDMERLFRHKGNVNGQ